MNPSKVLESKEETLVASGVAVDAANPDETCCVVKQQTVASKKHQPWPRCWNRPTPMTLTFALASTDAIDYIERTEIFDALGRALNRWAQFVPVSFLPITEYNAADIKVSFYIGKHGKCRPFRDTSLGHSFGPNDGRIHINGAKQWCVGFAGRSKDAIHLERVFTHEAGHALGLDHSSNIDALMYPDYSVARKTELTIDDIKRIQDIYGPNPSFNLNSFPLETTLRVPTILLAMTEFFQSSTSNFDPNAVVQICHCGLVAKRGQRLNCSGSLSKVSINYGRCFHKCASNSCSFFKWADPVHPERINSTIKHLLQKKNKYKELNMELEKKLCILEAENAFLRDHSEPCAEQKKNSAVEVHDADADNSKVLFFMPMLSVPVIVSTIVAMSVCIIAKNCYKR